MAYQPVEALRVLAWGRPVGVMVPAARGPYATFQYEPSWLRSGVDLAPSTMPLADGDRLYTFRDLDPAVFRGLPPFLADSTPDMFGSALIEARLAELGVAASAVTGLDRLAFVGRRGMGALTFEPDRGPAGRPETALELAELVEAAQAAVAGDLGSEPGRRAAVADLLAIGTSAGGAQAKAVVAWNRTTGELRAGHMRRDSGFEPWLLKFDGVGTPGGALTGRPGFGRVEHAYSSMARAAGIDMSPTELLEESGRAHFLTRRFDRVGDDSLHLQSLCALVPLDFHLLETHSYASYFLQLDALGLGEAARQEAFRRVVFNVLAGNRDDHAKNFSFLMDQTGAWSLAPAYDLTFAWVPGHFWLGRHHFSVEGKFEGITRRDLLQLADRCAVPGAARLLDQVAAAVADWPTHAAASGVDPDTTSLISRRLEALTPANGW